MICDNYELPAAFGRNEDINMSPYHKTRCAYKPNAASENCKQASINGNAP
jgi:hypothetical protein